jgi:NAD(P)-dependent dehydrogenase (short-subunit alcohol dehydrogenase family)
MEKRKPKWTIEGKTCLITGATSGIGKATAIELAKRGAQIIYTARDLEKAKIVKEEIISKSQNNDVEFFECELSSLESIKKLAENFKKRYLALHVLINNAGLWEAHRKLSKDGIELTFAVNYLAQFLLTDLLLGLLKKSAPSRVINVSSELHRKGKINFDDLELKKHYNGMKAYYNSKLAIVLFTKELARRLQGTGVTANIAHPGLAKTDIYRALPSIEKKLIFLFGAITPEEGAKTSICLAMSDEVSNISGEYFARGKITKSSDESYDIEEVRKLWNISVEYVKKYIEKSEV